MPSKFGRYLASIDKNRSRNIHDWALKINKKKLFHLYLFAILFRNKDKDNETIDIDSDSMNAEGASICKFPFVHRTPVSINKVQTHGKDLLVSADTVFFPHVANKDPRQRETRTVDGSRENR